MNPNNSVGFTPSAQNLSDQADMYQYVAESFKRNVPVAQRYDITVWGVADSDSWIVTVQKRDDFPLLFDKNYAKKQAYASFLKALKQ